jgi:hypothetical protein
MRQQDLINDLPTQVDFERENGTHIRNIVSEGPGYGLDQLHMTYTFEFLRPELEEGSEAAEKEGEHTKQVRCPLVDSFFFYCHCA